MANTEKLPPIRKTSRKMKYAFLPRNHHVQYGKGGRKLIQKSECNTLEK